MPMDSGPKTGRDIDHAQRPVRRLGAACGRDVPEVFAAPVRWSIAEIPLDVEAPALVVHKQPTGQGPVTAPQDDRGVGLGAPVGLGDQDAMEGRRALFVEEWPLRQPGLPRPLHGGRGEGVRRQGVVIHLAALWAPGTSPASATGVGQGERRIVPQLGKQGQGARARPLAGGGVAAGPV
jgi:hypothetical protein